jgi:lipid A oxidase
MKREAGADNWRKPSRVAVVATQGVVALILAAAGQLGARAEFVTSVFGGITFTDNNDLRLRQTGGTDLIFRDVSYRSKDFDTPPYYGARLSYFPPAITHWGFGVEFVHAKLYLNTDETVHVTGTRNRSPVNDYERVGDTIEGFDLSHGLNFLTADVIYRWFLAERSEKLLGRLQPYAGAGIGAVVPHVESSIGGVHFGQYQWHGPGVQGFVGINLDLARHWSVFLEYKLSYADLDLTIPNGSINVSPWTHHLVTGLSFRF